MTLPSEADIVAEPELRELYHYWSQKRGRSGYPSRADIEPEQIKRLLPFVLLLDVMDGGQHFRFRLVGTDAASGIDPTGKLLHEAAPEGVYRNHISALFARGAAGPGALYSRATYAYDDAPGPRSISRVFLPLATDGKTVDMLMIGQKATRDLRSGRSAWQANPPVITEELEVRLP
jgi:PAS domain